MHAQIRTTSRRYHMLSDVQAITGKLGAVIQILQGSLTSGAYVPEGAVASCRALAMHAIEQYCPPGAVFQKHARAIDFSGSIEDAKPKIAALLGIVQALQLAYVQGLFDSLPELVRAEVFDDFLNMVSYLLKEGFKDAAAVMAGGVIEEHLRKLCIKHSLPLTFSTAKG